MKLRVSYTAGAGFVVNWPGLCARERGFYREEGLEVELVPLYQAEQTSQLISGETPVERRGPDEDIVLIERGEPLRIVAGLARKPPITLFAQPGIPSVQHLRGATIAGVSGKYGSTLALRMLLQDEGLADEDVTVTSTGGTLPRYAALRSGAAVATLLSPPTSAQAAAAGYTRLVNLAERYPSFLYSALQANTDWTATHRSALVALIRADIRGQQWLYDPANREEAIALLADADRMDRVDANACYEETVVRDQIYCRAGEIDPSMLADLIAGLARLGDIGPKMAAADYLDLGPLTEARTSLGIA
jgi:ABC-type nitrate/sulfonate/bicarbonate transport system substrate-binding protein